MEELVCRDCGRKLPAQARGCPTCAWNIEAEQKVERVVWLALLLVLLGVVTFVVAYLRLV